MRGDRIGDLIEVVPFKVQSFLGKSHMAVGIDKARIHFFAGKVDDLLVVRVRTLGHRTHGRDFLSRNLQKAIGDTDKFPCGSSLIRLHRLHGDQMSMNKEHDNLQDE